MCWPQSASLMLLDDWIDAAVALVCVYAWWDGGCLARVAFAVVEAGSRTLASDSPNGVGQVSVGGVGGWKFADRFHKLSGPPIDSHPIRG